MSTLNTVEYNQATRRMYPLNTTSSYSLNSISASYSLTASYAINGGGGGYNGTSSYTTLISSSTNWITASFVSTENYFALTNGTLYNFTCSNLPSPGNVYALSIFINNTSTTTSSFSFPSNWIFMGAIPTYLTSSKNAILSLKAYGTSSVVAGFAVQY